MRRHKPLLYWLSGHKYDVRFSEVLGFTFSMPFKYLGKKKLTMLTKESDFYRAEFDGISRPIYWPEEFPIETLYQVAAELLYKNWWNYEIAENPILPDDCVVDCGAAEGAFTLQIADRCKKVFAIEPHPKFVEAMKRSFNQLSNVEILQVIVGNKAGSAKLSDAGIMSQESDTGIEVTMETLDNLFFHKGIKVDYIKADLEGSELGMLQGAEQLIKNWKPKLSITTYHYSRDYNNTIKYLKDICPDYKFKAVGITDQFGTPIMLHAWV